MPPNLAVGCVGVANLSHRSGPVNYFLSDRVDFSSWLLAESFQGLVQQGEPFSSLSVAPFVRRLSQPFERGALLLEPAACATFLFRAPRREPEGVGTGGSRSERGGSCSYLHLVRQGRTCFFLTELNRLAADTKVPDQR
jgi:hypothetical protein